MVDKKEIEYVKSMKHILGCFCIDGESNFTIGRMKLFGSPENGLWYCYDLNDKTFCALEDLVFCDEYDNVIGDYKAYTMKYYGINLN